MAKKNRNHVGNVIGGIVGTKIYIYDIFDDAINVAYRIQNHSKPMKIYVSEEVYNKIQNNFCFKRCF